MHQTHLPLHRSRTLIASRNSSIGRIRFWRSHALRLVGAIVLLLSAAIAAPQVVLAQQAQEPAGVVQPDPAPEAAVEETDAQPSDAPAETPASASVETEAFTEAENRLRNAEADLGRLRGAIEDASTDDVRLTDLRIELEALANSMIDLGVGVSPRLNDIRTRLEQLGAAPGKASRRSRRSSPRSASGWPKSGRASTRSSDRRKKSRSPPAQEAARITELRRQLFADMLFSRSTINGALFSEAGAILVDEIAQFHRIVTGWANFTWSYKRAAVFQAAFLSLLIALVMVAGGYRVFGRFMNRDPAAEAPSYISRLSVAFWSTVIPTAAAAVSAVSIYAIMEALNLLRADIAPLVALLLGISVSLLFVGRLTYAVLAPSAPRWRLLNVSNRGAGTLALYILAITLVSGIDYFLGGVSRALGSDVAVTVAKTFVAVIVIGVLLIAVSLVRPMMVDEAVFEGRTIDHAEYDRQRRWSPYIAIPLRIAGGLLILLSLAGYVGLARFISTQIIVTGAILATMYIGFLCGRAVSTTDDFGSTMLGRFLVNRGKLGPVALDQAGLVSGLAIYALVIVLGLPLILLVWGFQPRDIQSWVVGLITEIRVGNISISLIGIAFGVLVFIIGFLATRWFQGWVDGNVLARGRVDVGVRNSISTAVGYAGVALAGIIGVSAAGIDLSSLALVAGALSLGIGFGLQTIVSNFVSGLILLAERPFKVGDWIVTGTTEGTVKRISVRSTEIETFQKQSIIVPNSELINASVGNWTHRNHMGRVDILVSASYSSDPRQVMAILQDVGQSHPMVMRNPEPLVIFANFGESSLDFELRVHIGDVGNGLRVRTDLRLAIFDRFKEAGVEMPFPQRDLNIRFEEDDRGEAGAALKKDRKALVRTIAAQASETLDDGEAIVDQSKLDRISDSDETADDDPR
jgi:potassium efflux system protein